MGRKILIITSSYPPEIGAAPGRIGRIAALLQRRGEEVHVITSMPNYPFGRTYRGYRYKLYHSEVLEGVKVFRTALLPSNSWKKLPRVISIVSYIFSFFAISLFKILSLSPDIIIVNSPPFVTGICGTLAARLTKAKVILNVSDLWPLSLLELGKINKGFLYKILLRLEAGMYKRTDFFTGQSQAILDHIKKCTRSNNYFSLSSNNYFLYYNLKSDLFQAKALRSVRPKKIVYSGLLGIAQGVSEICFGTPFAALNAELHIYGEGSDRKSIEQYISANPGCNIYYHGSVGASDMFRLLSDYDVMLVPLKTHITGAIPSKLFDAIASGLPVLFSGSGEGAEIVNSYGIGWTNAAADYGSLSRNIQLMTMMSPAAYQAMRKNCVDAARTIFNKEIQDEQFYRFISTIDQPRSL